MKNNANLLFVILLNFSIIFSTITPSCATPSDTYAYQIFGLEKGSDFKLTAGLYDLTNQGNNKVKENYSRLAQRYNPGNLTAYSQKTQVIGEVLLKMLNMAKNAVETGDLNKSIPVHEGQDYETLAKKFKKLKEAEGLKKAEEHQRAEQPRKFEALQKPTNKPTQVDINILRSELSSLTTTINSLANA